MTFTVRQQSLQFLGFFNPWININCNDKDLKQCYSSARSDQLLFSEARIEFSKAPQFYFWSNFWTWKFKSHWNVIQLLFISGVFGSLFIKLPKLKSWEIPKCQCLTCFSGRLLVIQMFLNRVVPMPLLKIG